MSDLYDAGVEAFLSGNLSWTTDEIRALLIDVADYTVDLNGDRVLDDIPAGAIVAVSDPLTGKSATDGAADCADYKFEEVSGDPCEAVVYYHHTGNAETSTLIAYFDDSFGLPVTPNGGDINVKIDHNGPNKLFHL